MPETKTFIYRYDDDRENEEEVTDSLGEVDRHHGIVMLGSDSYFIFFFFRP